MHLYIIYGKQGQGSALQTGTSGNEREDDRTKMGSSQELRTILIGAL